LRKLSALKKLIVLGTAKASVQGIFIGLCPVKRKQLNER